MIIGSRSEEGPSGCTTVRYSIDWPRPAAGTGRRTWCTVWPNRCAVHMVLRTLRTSTASSNSQIRLDSDTNLVRLSREGLTLRFVPHG